ncbi:HEPN domain-containing protein [Candidatus Hydrogenedentota bacterium]
MKPPEEDVIRTIVDAWLRKAELDIRSAETLISQDPPLLYPACFHSQQAAEKYLKAYLTRHQVEFPKTHSIREILNIVGTIDEALAEILASAPVLTPFGVEIRYPGDMPEPTREETEEALALAHMVRDEIQIRLKNTEEK